LQRLASGGAQLGVQQHAFQQHRDTAASNLGAVLLRQGCLDEAERLLRPAVRGLTEVHGWAGQKTLSARLALTLTVLHAGATLEEARPLEDGGSAEWHELAHLRTFEGTGRIKLSTNALADARELVALMIERGETEEAARLDARISLGWPSPAEEAARRRAPAKEKKKPGGKKSKKER
jgi:hypothetical protein